MPIDQHTIYLDNFRGFSDTYVPIADVNFMVGENSTGKTSLLSILKLVSSDSVLGENQFYRESDDINLGTFHDIVSARSANQNYFRIGMIRRNVEDSMPLGMLVTYERHEGVPMDTRFTCTFEDREIALRRVGRELHYRIHEKAITPETNIRALFAKWIEEQDRPNGGKDVRKFDFPLEPEQSLLFPLSLIAQSTMLGKSALRGPVRLLPANVFPPLTWIAPVRTKPRRTYDELRRGFSAEGTHTPYLIRKILGTASEAKRFKRVIGKVGKESGLFDSVYIKRFGPDVAAPFEVHIVLGRKSFNLTNVGYGVSQALPVLVEVLWRRPETWFAIQQPEVHLHPRAQAALGDLVFTLATTDKKGFLIETHSDFMIDRFRTNFRKKGSPKPKAQVLFFERTGDRNRVTALQIDNNGEMPSEQPKAYRDFFLKETRRVLDI